MTNYCHCSYVLDSNAIFLTATEVVRQRQAMRPNLTGNLVVDIGCPLIQTASLWDTRRDYDLTLTCEQSTAPKSLDCKPRPHEYGSSDKFLLLTPTVVQSFLLG